MTRQEANIFVNAYERFQVLIDDLSQVVHIDQFITCTDKRKTQDLDQGNGHILFPVLFEWDDVSSVLDATNRGVMYTFNAVTAFVLLWIACVSVFFRKGLLETRFGKCVLILFSGFWSVRAASAEDRWEGLEEAIARLGSTRGGRVLWRIRNNVAEFVLPADVARDERRMAETLRDDMRGILRPGSDGAVSVGVGTVRDGLHGIRRLCQRKPPRCPPAGRRLVQGL